MPSAVRFPTLLAAAVFLAACGSNPPSGDPSPVPAAAPAAPAAPAGQAAAPRAQGTPQPSSQLDLSGEWEIRIGTTQAGTESSMMRLVRRGSAYVGILQTLLMDQTPSQVPIRSATVAGNQVTILLDMEDDPYAQMVLTIASPTRMNGQISSRSLSGRVEARKR